MGIVNIIKKKKNVIIGCIIILLVVCIVVTVIFAFQGNSVEVDNEATNDYHSITYQDKQYEYNTSIISILFMGIDTDDPEQDQGQADVMELLLLDRNSKKIQVISIPRDTMTEIRLFDVSGNDLGWQRQHLNLAYAYGTTPETGCMYSLQAVSRMFKDIPIVRYAAMNLNMLEEVHEIVGTVPVKVPNNSLVDVNYLWRKGNTVNITKKNVESFLRTRDTEEDFSNSPRMERQEAYLKAYYAELKTKLEKDFDNTVEKLYGVLKEMTTNITYSDIESFAKMILEYEFDSDQDFYTLEGKNVSGQIHDEFELDEKKLEELIVKLFYKEEES